MIPTYVDSGSTKAIELVGPDEALIDQVVPDEEELNEWETSPTPNWNKPSA